MQTTRRRFLHAFALVLAPLAGCGAGGAQTLPERIDALFRAAHEHGDFDGNALVTRGGRTIYQASFGLADARENLANGPDTRFLAFSITKPLTAMLVFQQIEAGALALPDRLEKFFPELAGRPAGALTIEQLLTHTSRIEEVISKHRQRRITPADLVDAAVRKPVQFEYSNTGFTCLALVLEAVTGKSYAALLEQRILVPAGMRDSGVLRSGVVVPGLAVGHRTEGGTRRPEPVDVSPEAFEGAGNLYTTTGDLARLDRALAAGKLLSPASQAAMLRQHTPERGYGWALAEQGGKLYPWHKGSYRGFTGVLVRQIHRDEAVVILSNDSANDLDALRKDVLKILKRDAAAD